MVSGGDYPLQPTLLLLPLPAHPHACIQADTLRDPPPPSINFPSLAHSLPHNKHGREIWRCTPLSTERNPSRVSSRAGPTGSPAPSRRAALLPAGLLLDALRPAGLLLGRGLRPVAGRGLLPPDLLLVLRADSGLCHRAVPGGASVKFPMVRLRFCGKRRERLGGGRRGGGVGGGGLQHQGQRWAGRWPRRRGRGAAWAGHQGRSPRLLQALHVAFPGHRSHFSAGAGLEVGPYSRNWIWGKGRGERGCTFRLCVCVGYICVCVCAARSIPVCSMWSVNIQGVSGLKMPECLFALFDVSPQPLNVGKLDSTPTSQHPDALLGQSSPGENHQLIHHNRLTQENEGPFVLWVCVCVWVRKILLVQAPQTFPFSVIFIRLPIIVWCIFSSQLQAPSLFFFPF